MTVLYASAQYHLGDYVASREAYSQAVTLARSAADKPSEARILGYLSAVQGEQGLLLEAVQSAEHALALASELNDPGLAGEEQMLLAFDYRDLGRLDEAIHYCQAAVVSYQKIEAPELVAKAQVLLAELQSDRNLVE